LRKILIELGQTRERFGERVDRPIVELITVTNAALSGGTKKIIHFLTRDSRRFGNHQFFDGSHGSDKPLLLRLGQFI
jgi:hypothetical protein